MFGITIRRTESLGDLMVSTKQTAYLMRGDDGACFGFSDSVNQKAMRAYRLGFRPSWD